MRIQIVAEKDGQGLNRVRTEDATLVEFPVRQAFNNSFGSLGGMNEICLQNDCNESKLSETEEDRNENKQRIDGEAAKAVLLHACGFQRIKGGTRFS
jgi:hypothetical protein